MLTLFVGACGGTSPTGPSSAVGTGVSCRRVASAFSSVSTTTLPNGSIVSTVETTCAFVSGTRTLTCGVRNVTPGVCPNPGDSSMTEYGSVVDFIDEAAVVGRTRWTRRVSTTSASMLPPNCGVERRTLQNDTINQFDSQGRLVGATFTASELSPSPKILQITDVSYGSWDSQGRPTVDSGTVAGGPISMATTTYDDVARTETTTAPGLTIVVRFDPDGNIVEGRNITPAVTQNTVITIGATQLVCR